MLLYSGYNIRFINISLLLKTIFKTFIISSIFLIYLSGRRNRRDSVNRDVQCTVHSVSVHCIAYNVQCIPVKIYSIMYPMHSAHCTLFPRTV